MGGSVVLGFSLSFNDLMHSDGIQKAAPQKTVGCLSKKADIHIYILIRSSE
jgi:hypothetical protein